jgi:predicted DNA-binding transcriptional regulator YafY
MSTHGTIERCLNIIRKLQINQKISSAQLADELNVGIRTIQKDINERLRAFPIETDRRGLYWLSETRLDRSTLLDDEEEVVLMLALDMLDESDNISQYSRSIMQKLLDSRSVNPFYIKQKEFEKIDIDSIIVNALENSIAMRYIVKIITEGKSVEVAPYKIVNFDGIWYLYAQDRRDYRIRTWLLSDIRDVKKIDKYHDQSHESIEKALENTHTAWFEDGGNYEVKVKVYPEIAEYFKLRKHLSSQEICEEFDDGSLLISFDISTDEDVDNLIKSWLPHIEVVSPEKFKNRIIDELQNYLKKITANDSIR